MADAGRGGVGAVRGRPGQRPGAAGRGFGGATRPPDPDFRPKPRHRHGAVERSGAARDARARLGDD